MASFNEFIQDYNAHEHEESQRFFKRVANGEVKAREMYPPRERFHKLNMPLAEAVGPNIWGVVPFHGSTFAPLLPRGSKREFDDISQILGFTSRDLDRMISFCKETGRVQFVLNAAPIHYKRMDFLEPLLTELHPPALYFIPPELFADQKHIDRLEEEFKRNAKGAFLKYVIPSLVDIGTPSVDYLAARMDHYMADYICFNLFGYEELAKHATRLMVESPSEALEFYNVLGNLIAAPRLKPFQVTAVFLSDELTRGKRLLQQANVQGESTRGYLPYDIGRFVLRKTVLYPETIDGCMEVMQRYDHVELNRIQQALHNAISRNDRDRFMTENRALEEACENVWKDADRVNLVDRIGGLVPELVVGVIGELAGPIPGMGILSAVGLKALDLVAGGRITGAVADHVRHFFLPDYLVEVYDFKQEHPEITASPRNAR